MPQEKKSFTGPHIFEIDLIRSITVFSVVVIHSLASSQYLISSNGPSAYYFINLIIHFLQYNREMFMFVTGLVLTYAYFGKPFSAKKFWLKRTLLIFIPYLFWSIFYVKINNPLLDFPMYLKTLGFDLLIGGASYQLYYILLALQFYLVFPLFLHFLKTVYRHPWLTLIVSFLLELIAMYLDFRFVLTGTWRNQLITQVIIPYQDRIIITYQFFFIFGALAAIYMKQCLFYLQKFGRFLPILFIGMVVFFTWYYYLSIDEYNADVFYVTSAFQPVVVIYSTFMTIFFVWLATLWTKHLRFYPVIKIISDTSFGIYFVHVFFIEFVIKYILPYMGDPIPVFFRIGFVFIATFIISLLFCYTLLKIPFLAWMIGKGGKSG